MSLFFLMLVFSVVNAVICLGAVSAVFWALGVDHTGALVALFVIFFLVSLLVSTFAIELLIACPTGVL